MRKQKGFSFFGMLFVIIAIIIIGFLALKIVPVYIDNYAVKSSIKTLREIPATEFSDDATLNAMTLKNKLLNQLTVNGMQDIPAEQVSVTPVDEKNYRVSVKYKVIKPILNHVSLMFDFDETQEVTIGSKQ